MAVTNKELGNIGLKFVYCVSVRSLDRFRALITILEFWTFANILAYLKSRTVCCGMRGDNQSDNQCRHKLSMYNLPLTEGRYICQIPPNLLSASI